MSSKVAIAAKIQSDRGSLNIGFVIAWLFCAAFYFMQYMLRSAPGVMVPELSTAFARDALGVGTLVGLYYYTYALFSIVFGALLDRLGGKAVIPAGVVLVAVGAALFGLGSLEAAQIGRLLQGAGSACGFIGAMYLATRGFPSRSLATAVGFTQCFGMLGGSAGQFAVAPLIHGLITWQQFWWFAGIVIFLIAALMFIATPAPHDDNSVSPGSWMRMFAPYKEVLSNPQSYLCGFCAGLLFLPTTIGDMIWGIPFLRGGLDVSYAEAVNRASMVPLGWVIGCPLLGYLSDRLGRRKPVFFFGALLMLASGASIFYLPVGVAPPYVLGLLLGIGSGAAMLPYTVIKEVNPDNVKGSASGAINFLVFTFSAVLTLAYGKLLANLANGGAMNLPVFRTAGSWLLGGVVLAMILAIFMRETGPSGRAVSGY
ncbi:MFS transporter [Paraburkholderia kirstenboschensis]|uniref:Lysosomal dipeptide transporter MFSD1 n=1 Tax=Paraburkholderia kirstenboschensis TaxID=1245436 RepID=A0ABZ0EAI7_9BURK|nr:MFS transporter [Paraburkholderia kirstenboschensis]WOD13494.1 MFS transporter [Paraburkholderia kirstenboschensis]